MLKIGTFSIIEKIIDIIGKINENAANMVTFFLVSPLVNFHIGTQKHIIKASAEIKPRIAKTMVNVPMNMLKPSGKNSSGMKRRETKKVKKIGITMVARGQMTIEAIPYFTFLS
jgi:hypothetical protein